MNLKNSILKRINKLRYYNLNKKRLKTTKSTKIWCFLPYGNAFTGNIKAVFQSVSSDTNIKKIILVDKKTDSLLKESINNSIILISKENLNKKNYELLAKASILITDQLPDSYNILKNIQPFDIPILNLWHGIPLKKMFYTVDNVEPFSEPEKKLNHFIASSELDAQSMQKCFQVPNENIHITGLPRIDLLKHPTPDIHNEQEKLKKNLNGKSLILFAPTWRKNPKNNYKFNSQDLKNLSHFLKKNNYILGVREHFHTSSSSYYLQLKELDAISLNNTEYPNIEALLLQAKILITDYSSCHYDFLYLNKPSLSFAYDYDSYENGFLYDFSSVFEYSKNYSISELIDQLESLQLKKNKATYTEILNKFYSYQDNQNTVRVIELIKKIIS